MSEKTNHLSRVYNQIRKEYNGIQEIIMEDEAILVYADDEILWKIFEDKIDECSSVELDAGSQESHFIKIIP